MRGRLSTPLALCCLTLALLGFVPLAALGEAKGCTHEESIAAEQAADQLHDWYALYDAYRRWAHCDEGVIAEGFSASVVRLLSSQWDQFAAFQGFADADGNFLAFVLGHVDGTTHEPELRKVIVNATQRCPSDARAVCIRLQKAAQAALKHS